MTKILPNKVNDVMQQYPDIRLSTRNV